jgi:hypothetical protein
MVVFTMVSEIPQVVLLEMYNLESRSPKACARSSAPILATCDIAVTSLELSRFDSLTRSGADDLPTTPYS